MRVVCAVLFCHERKHHDVPVYAVTFVAADDTCFMIIQKNVFTCHGMFSERRRTEISLLLNYYEN
ncbi:hypothetical protein ARF22_18180 [Salmonella enterica subsp. enterica serovar Heidelberg]|uniref:Uncharacterized protein n=4 Tax=Enterobacteriaceae TaxID=543 RepID=A0A290JJ98_ECOLX|nr:hypothetical protein B1200_08700 [Escherichia coli]AXF92092.1 hypothetical protein APECO2_27270 [Escherichia coli APEC O2-211]EAA1670710.1 hypothetical protein [Salmonella enterica subsp. enterica serovar Kentucky]EAA3601156.1 hypothetical protein [Salmonella enterica subsp. enterica serovar Schwarzengrund]EAN7684984.1 hypothetical protein [Salmonella enterica]EAV4002474.1 hypothetical protein [Salmonella enterica subsp. enterica serovar Uganda]EBD8286518.1 hypothetical protein [Salmonella